MSTQQTDLAPVPDSQDIDLQTEEGLKFHRGSALTIFSSDRREDMVALALSLLIAIGVYAFVN